MTPSVYSLVTVGIIVSVIYWIIPVNVRTKYLSIVSISIYCLWSKEVSSVFLLLFEIVLGYFVCLILIHVRRSKMCLTMGIVSIVICLAFFKYKNSILTADSLLLRIVIPLGISYYSFKIISIMIETYRNNENEIGWWDYVTYISFFPQVICGPISRKDEILSYIKASISSKDVGEGLYIILKGLFYKTVIADRLSVYTMAVFESYDTYNYIALFLTVFFFSIELYCDFAGYSYIVIGISRLMGIRIKDNFHTPYFATNIKEFWTRWHISLSSWLRDYIYIPLGGNRKGILRKNINILIVFLVSGLWHGNTFTYVLWGIWHGIWNILSPREIEGRLIKIISTLFTFAIVSIGWLTFRLDNLNDIMIYIARMFSIKMISFNILVEAVLPFSGDYSSVAKMIIAIIMICLLLIMEYDDYRMKEERKLFRVFVYLTCIVLFGIMGSNRFIYANY